jgi:predicted CoA-binding protein
MTNQHTNHPSSPVTQENRDAFLQAHSFAVAGASIQREKYGNILFRTLRDAGRDVYPLNPRESIVEGNAAFPDLRSLPVVPQAVSIVTPPAVTREIVQQAIELGVRSVWMQPGAEDPEAGQLARQAGLNVIDDGSCLLIFLNRIKK